MRQLTHLGADAQSPEWWPGCEWIYFQTNKDGNWELHRTNDAGTAVGRVTERVGQDLLDGQVTQGVPVPPPAPATSRLSKPALRPASIWLLPWLW